MTRSRWGRTVLLRFGKARPSGLRIRRSRAMPTRLLIAGSNRGSTRAPPSFPQAR